MNSDVPFNSPAKDTTAVGVEPTVVRVELSLKSLLVVLALIGGLWMLLHLVPVLLALVAAFMMVGALHPLVVGLERRKVKRVVAICILFGVGAMLAATVATFIIPTIRDQARTFVQNEPRIRESVATFLERSTITTGIAEELRNVRYADLMKSSRATLLAMSTRLVEFLAYGVAAVFLAFYIMIDRDRLRGALFAAVPRRHHLRLSAILLNLVTIVGGYIRGQVFICLLMSGFILVLLLACRVPNALMIAVFGGALDLLPYIGIFCTMAPAVLAASMKGPTVAAIVFVLMLAYEELESRVLIPLVYGRALRLPSSVIFFSLIAGTTLAGIAGTLLALPIAAAVLMLIDELRVELPGTAIQPEDIKQRQKDEHMEREYERRAENLPVAEAAAVAAEISVERKKVDVATKKATDDAKEASLSSK